MQLFDIVTSEILEKYKNLKKQIEEHNFHYYEENKSVISDYEYDNLLEELSKIENKYPELKKYEQKSPTEYVGGFVNERFKKITHNTPMLSLSNSYNITEIVEFNNRVLKIINEKYNISKIDYILELKLDGISISLVYKKGILTKAVTRGDGKIGEDVTENVFQIKSIPKKLKQEIDIEVRGEIVLPISEFNKINDLRKDFGEELLANPRNAAAGTIRQLDANVVKERNLDCYLYYLVDPESYGCKTHLESIEFIEKLGFKTTGIFELYNDFNEIEKSIETWNSKRLKLDYETDGLVIKVNDFLYYNDLGYTAKSPRWAIAYKFSAEQKETKVLDISFQVGRTGVITPVANLKPVRLSGSVVRRASLHNFDEIRRKDIRSGDTVIVEKAAEIIPQVVRVVFDKRKTDSEEFVEPTTCPSCNEPLKKLEGLVALKCINKYCPEQISKSISYFVSRDAMNIMGLGEKIVEKFIELGKLTSIIDIYFLNSHREELESMEKMGKKSVSNLLENIEKSKDTAYNKVLYSLGIPFVGKTTADLLIERFNDIEELKNADIELISSIKGIGEKVANSVHEYLKDEENWNMILGLKEIGLNFKSEAKEIKNNNFITGKNFLVTGKLEFKSREEIKQIIKEYGGNYLSTVSKNLDYLIVGEKPGSKLEKAKSQEINILTEQEFLEKI